MTVRVWPLRLMTGLYWFLASAPHKGAVAHKLAAHITWVTDG